MTGTICCRKRNVSPNDSIHHPVEPPIETEKPGARLLTAGAGQEPVGFAPVVKSPQARARFRVHVIIGSRTFPDP